MYVHATIPYSVAQLIFILYFFLCKKINNSIIYFLFWMFGTSTGTCTVQNQELSWILSVMVLVVTWMDNADDMGQP